MKTPDEIEKERRELHHREDIRNVLSSESGRRILGGIMAHGGMWRSSFLISGGKTESTEFYEGMRYLALIVYNDCKKHSPDMLIKLLGELEHDNRQASESNATRNG